MLHVAICRKLPAIQVLLVVSEEMQITGPQLPIGLATGRGTAVGRIWTTLPTVCVQFSPFFGASCKAPGRQAICNGCQHAAGFRFAVHTGDTHGQVRFPGKDSDALCP